MKGKLIVLASLAVVVSVSLMGAACGRTESNANTAMNRNGAMMNSNSSMGNMNGTGHNAMPMNSNMQGMDHGSMRSAPNSANAPFDLQFIDTMIAHHQSAIDMARIAAMNTDNAELKKFAGQIVDDQTREIGQLTDWREKWYPGQPPALNMEMPGMRDSMGMDMTALESARGRDFDAEFVRMMTPHHAGAVAMARDALTKAEHPEIKTLANQIVKAQEAEMKMMERWRTEWSK